MKLGWSWGPCGSLRRFASDAWLLLASGAVEVTRLPWVSRRRTMSAPIRWALFRAAERIVGTSPLATASRKPKSAANTATPLASCPARKRISCCTKEPPERSCSAARASTLCAVLASTAASVTVWVTITSPMISTRSRLRKLPMKSARMHSAS